ncbi:MAG: hypothetical protein HOH82_15975 [Planctomycetaceae bacterium]|jgi:hypothetical protein|nr:hypothetical protein [Planctomycetaceae bacterium]
MRYFTFLTMLLSITLVGSNVNAAESGMLRWKLKAGDTFYLKNVQRMKQTITANGRDVKQNSTQISFIQFSVKRLTPEGGAVVEQTLLKISSKGNLSGAGDTGVNDKLKGVKFTLTLDSDHKIVKFEGYEEFIKKVTDGDKAVEAALRVMVAKETMQKTASEIFSQLPRKIVSTGDTWKRAAHFSMGPIGEMAINATYIYYGKATVEDTPVDRIQYIAAMKYSPPKANGSVKLPFTITKVSLNSDEFSGTIHFNPETGRIVDTTLNMKISGELTFLVDDQDRTVSLKQEMTIEAHILDENPLQPGN